MIDSRILYKDTFSCISCWSQTGCEAKDHFYLIRLSPDVHTCPVLRIFIYFFLGGITHYVLDRTDCPGNSAYKSQLCGVRAVDPKLCEHREEGKAGKEHLSSQPVQSVTFNRKRKMKENTYNKNTSSMD